MAHAEGAEAMGSRVRSLNRLRSEVDRLVPPPVAPPIPRAANRGRIGAPAPEDDAGAQPDAGHDRSVG